LYDCMPGLYDPSPGGALGPGPIGLGLWRASGGGAPLGRKWNGAGAGVADGLLIGGG
jgi:hypothetical protein